MDSHTHTHTHDLVRSPNLQQCVPEADAKFKKKSRVFKTIKYGLYQVLPIVLTRQLKLATPLLAEKV